MLNIRVSINNTYSNVSKSNNSKINTIIIVSD
nr:MAG TPA: hypothetical protein [Crassvirales sp.]